MVPSVKRSFLDFLDLLLVHLRPRRCTSFRVIMKRKEMREEREKKKFKVLVHPCTVRVPGTDSSSEVSQSVSSLQNNITVNLVVQVLTTTYYRYLLLTVHGVGRNFLVPQKIMR